MHYRNNGQRDIIHTRGTPLRFAAASLIIFFSVFGLCPLDALAKRENKKTTVAEARHRPAKKAAVESDGAVEAEKKEKDEPAQSVAEEPRKEAAAEEGDLYKFEKPAVEDESYAWVVIKTLIVLGLMVGGFYYFFKFVTKRTGVQLAAGGAVQVLSMVPLGHNKFLHIVDLAGRVLVLGVTDNAVSLIAEIKDRDEIDRIRIAGSKVVPAQPGGFQDFLTQQLGRFLKRKMPGAKSEAHVQEEIELDRMEYLARQRERLKRLNGTEHED